WENGKNLPDIENLMIIAELTNQPYQNLLAAGLSEKDDPGLQFRTRLFKEENMFTRMKTSALSEDLKETYRALYYMRSRHAGQYRKKGKYVSELVEYINHPLLMACQAHAFGIRDDALLAAILLHDTVEDTGITAEELPFSEEVRLLVSLVTFCKHPCETEEEAKNRYYSAIRQNPKACVIKIIDRCNNLSTMAGSFANEKILGYIDETERYILPLTDLLKHEYPEYSDVSFLAKYQMLGLIETAKNLMA
ncbi:MAG: hypothetical protein IJ130_12615, partial [Solobacterium sp.]|nr:hypothetical protein [Solobacterium sp.]